ncbi:MAG: hypothetical protein H8D23_23545 [Candidatus Brocadiales bacterium]|nr:hypothetical protein [Candidatus Brocadiales bacterium]
MSDITGEKVLNLGEDAGQEPAFVAASAAVQRTTDPVILPQPYASPADFSAQYPTPLDPTEVIAMCEEVTLLQAIPEVGTSLQQHTWREMTSLAFTSGSAYIAFADGECPEEYTHDGSNTTITLKNLGAKKSLSISDIMHSQAVAAANWHGINTLNSPFPTGEGMPGGLDMGTFQMEHVAGVKEKEVRLAMTLVLNGYDRLLALGNASNNSLEFDGIEQWATNQSCTMHTNDNTSSGTFSAIAFDRFLSEGCAKPTHIFGHPAPIQEMLSAYFQLGFQGSQVVNMSDGNRMTPGFNFAGFVNTGVGRLQVVADNNFTRTDIGGGNFQADLWALRMTHNGQPLIYRNTQIPLAMKDLVPGCTAVSFQIWTKTALIIRACCAQARYKSQFTGRLTTTCTSIV